MRTEEGKATNKVGNWSFTSSGNQRRAHNAEFSPPFPTEGPGAGGLYPITQSLVQGCSQKMTILQYFWLAKQATEARLNHQLNK